MGFIAGLIMAAVGYMIADRIPANSYLMCVISYVAKGLGMSLYTIGKGLYYWYIFGSSTNNLSEQAWFAWPVVAVIFGAVGLIVGLYKATQRFVK